MIKSQKVLMTFFIGIDDKEDEETGEGVKYMEDTV